MRIGYVKNKDIESIEKQLNNIVKDGIDEVILDRTGERLPEVLSRLQSGDSLHISSLDRLSRQIREASRIIETLQSRGVEVYVSGNRFEFPRLISEEIDGK